MGEIRAFSKRHRWTQEEEQKLCEVYAVVPREHLPDLFPGLTARVIESKANGLGLFRGKRKARSREEMLRAKREDMARRRQADIDGARARGRAHHFKKHEENKAKQRAYCTRRFFWSRANKLRGEGKATHKELAALWKKQRGLCALTGRKLDRNNAHLDHIVAKARGGSDKIDNVRWVCREANLAKRELSDAQFMQLCEAVMRWIGERLDRVAKGDL
jgi:5-methylcytosine-specific restriction endonuclease McrA